MSVWNCKVYCIFVCRSFPNSGYSSKISCTSINSFAQAYRTFSKNSKPDDLFAEQPSSLHYTLGYLFLKKEQDLYMAYIMLKKSKM